MFMNLKTCILKYICTNNHEINLLKLSDCDMVPAAGKRGLEGREKMGWKGIGSVETTITVLVWG